MLAAGRTKVRRLSPVPAMKRHFAGSRSVFLTPDIDIDPASLGKLYFVFSRLERQLLSAVTKCGNVRTGRTVGQLEVECPVAGGSAAAIRFVFN